MNKAFLAGYIGETPELRHTDGGQSVLKFRVATSERYKDKSGEWQSATEWHTVIVWGPRGEALAKLLDRGSFVAIDGSIRTRAWEKDGAKHKTTEIIATNVDLGGRGAGGEQSRGDYQENQDPRPAPRGHRNQDQRKHGNTTDDDTLWG